MVLLSSSSLLFLFSGVVVMLIHPNVLCVIHLISINLILLTEKSLLWCEDDGNIYIKPTPPQPLLLHSCQTAIPCHATTIRHGVDQKIILWQNILFFYKFITFTFNSQQGRYKFFVYAAAAPAQVTFYYVIIRRKKKHKRGLFMRAQVPK